MAISIPVPPNLTKSERDLAQTLSEIIRRAVDGTNAISLAVTVTITTPGGGLIVTTPNGLHKYRIGVQNNGAVSATKIS